MFFCCAPTEPLMDEMLHRVPALEKAEIRQMVNGPEAFTADAHSIVGEAPEVSKSTLSYCQPPE